MTSTIEDADDLGGDYPGSHSSSKHPGDKRTFGELEDDEDDVFGSKKGKSKVAGPGADTGMILSLRESLQNCKDNLATCQAELEATRTEIQKWQTAFQNGPATPAGTTPDPGLVVTHLQNLKSSEESLREKLEKAKKREAAFIVTYAKREREIADLKSAVQDLKKQLRLPSLQARRFLLDPAIHEEFTRLKTLVEEKDKKVKELQDNVAAVNFSPSSRMGRMLMNKCKDLQKENEEIGARASEGKIHELGMEISALKSQNTELRSQFDALYQQMDGLTDDVERSQEMVFILQEKLEMKEYEIQRVKAELRRTKELLIQKESAPGELQESVPEEQLESAREELQESAPEELQESAPEEKKLSALEELESEPEEQLESAPEEHQALAPEEDQEANETKSGMET